MPRRLTNPRYRRRAPTSFAGIGLGERLRWSSGTILLEADVTPIDNPETVQPVMWASWADWASTYSLCREDFLRHFRIRHPNGTPGAERLFKAYKSGGDAGADAEAAIIAAGARAADPRRHLSEAFV